MKFSFPGSWVAHRLNVHKADFLKCNLGQDSLISAVVTFSFNVCKDVYKLSQIQNPWWPLIISYGDEAREKQSNRYHSQ